MGWKWHRYSQIVSLAETQGFIERFAASGRGGDDPVAEAAAVDLVNCAAMYSPGDLGAVTWSWPVKVVEGPLSSRCAELL